MHNLFAWARNNRGLNADKWCGWKRDLSGLSTGLGFGAAGQPKYRLPSFAWSVLSLKNCYVINIELFSSPLELRFFFELVLFGVLFCCDRSLLFYCYNGAYCEITGEICVKIRKGGRKNGWRDPKKAYFIPLFGLNARDDFMYSTWPLTKVF